MRVPFVGAAWVVSIVVGTATVQRTELQTWELPLPTGQFRVGRVTLHATDRSRVEPLSQNQSPRELAIDVWYPAEKGAEPASYLPPAMFRDPEAAEHLRTYLRRVFDAISAGRVQTHAFEGARFARGLTRAPVLVFSHGGGELKEAYTAQLTDLASHGYVVAAISHTFDSAVTWLGDGRHVFYSARRWPPLTTTFLEGVPPSQQANPEQLRWWAQDIRLAIDELGRANRATSSKQPFSERLDLGKIGAFGHSFGGEAAATACQLDRRIAACLDQDGLAARAPYYLADDGWGMDQAFMLIMRPGADGPPPEAELAAMNMTLAQALDLLNRMNDRQLATLRNTGRGSYRVVLVAEGTSHADFGDLPLLQAEDRAAADRRAEVLAVIRTYTRGFFDKTVKGLPATVLDAPPASRYVQAVERFVAGKRD